MDSQRLSTIAIKAIQHILRYHLGPNASLDKDDETIVRDSIEAIFPLRKRAQDIHVAHLEIACDAAVAFAQTFNKSQPQSQHVNLRWFYICVQSLLSIELKPELLQNGTVERISLGTEQLDDTSDSISEVNSASLGLSETEEDVSPQVTSVEPSVTADDRAPVPMKDPKSKWEEEELQEMIRLKDSGLTHKRVAERLGRTQSAVENKYGRLMSHRAMLSPTLKRGHDQEDDGDHAGNSGKKRRPKA
ncbi:hypothetical protein VM1G_05256 [Cytospora mali]|uniref:Myb-like domain-containing protein n=1 Tax=Cytospora mali TaxID=578113 RepID=A0A194W0I2_CYTMA|nr:hypothetical protein VM1G_05256 [Valsa mali]